MNAPRTSFQEALQAGREALQTSSMEYARECFATALELASTDVERAEAEGRLAQILGTLGRYTEAEALVLVALQHAGSDPTILAMIYMHWGVICWQQGKMQAARTFLEDAQTRMKALGHVRDRMVTLINLGTVLRAEGEYQRVLDVYSEAIAIAESLQDWPRLIAAANNLSRSMVDLGLYGEAERLLTRCLDLCNEQGLPSRSSAPWINIGYLAMVRGQLVESERALERALELSRTYAQHHLERQTLVQLAGLQVVQKDWAAAEATAQTLLGFDTAMQNLAQARLVLGRVEQARGNSMRALEYFAQGLLDAEGSFVKLLVLQFHVALSDLVAQPAIAAVHHNLARELAMQIIESLKDKALQNSFKQTPLAQAALRT